MAGTRGRLVAGLLALLAAAYAFWRHLRPAPPPHPIEVAPGVWRLETGSGLMAANVYFVRSADTWVLVDAASPGHAASIGTSAKSLFGADTRPAAILLTHSHPDHAGCARELADRWDVPVYVHPAEVPIIERPYVAELASPLDRWVLAPLTKVVPRAWMSSERVKMSLAGYARTFEPREGVPGLPDWRCIESPGHTPGHVSFFRPQDRVLIAGDALVTVRLNSLPDLLWQSPGLSGPPWHTTWDGRAARESVVRLAALMPDVLAGGHGVPMRGAGTAEQVRAFARRLVEGDDP